MIFLGSTLDLPLLPVVLPREDSNGEVSRDVASTEGLVTLSVINLSNLTNYVIRKVHPLLVCFILVITCKTRSGVFSGIPS